MRADVYLFQSCLPISLLAITANFAASSTPNYKTLTEKFLKAQILSHHVFSGSLVRYNKVLICGIILKILHNLALTDFSCFTFGRAHTQTDTHTLSIQTYQACSCFWTLSKHLSSSNASLACFSLLDNHLLKDKKLVLLIIPYFYLWTLCLMYNKCERVSDMNSLQVGTTSFKLDNYHLS